MTAETQIKFHDFSITDRHLLAVLEGAGLGVWLHEPATGRILWSDFLCRLLGYSSLEAPTTLAAWVALVHPADRQAVLAGINAVASAGSGCGELEFQIRCNSGAWSWVALRRCQVAAESNASALLTMGTVAMATIRPASSTEAHTASGNDLSSQGASSQHRVLDSLPSSIAVIDRAGLIVAVNQPWRDFACANNGSVIGLKQRAGVGNSYLDACQDLNGNGDISAIKVGIQAVLAGELPIFSAEYPCHSPTEQRWFTMTAMPLDDEAGGAVIAHTTITEQKLAEQALRNQLQLTSEIIDSAPGIFYLLDDAGHFLRWNKNLEKLSGYDGEAIAKMGALAFFDRDTKPRASKAIEETLTKGQSFLDASLLTQDGRYIPHYLTGRSTELNGKLCIIGFGVDITEQKRNALELEHHRRHLQHRVEERTRQLQHSEARMRSILQASPLGIGVVHERQLREVNEAMSSITGYSAEEMIGKSARILYLSDAEFNRVGEEKYAQIKSYGRGVIETVWRQKTGALRHILLASALIDPGNPALGSSFTAFDITDRKQIEQALAANEIFLRAITDALPSMVSHWDNALHCRFANRAYLEWFGKTPEQMQGKSIRGVLGEKLFMLNQAHIEAAIRGEGRRFERTLKKPSGEIGHVLVEYIPERSGNEVSGFYVMVTDVTMIKLAETELEESQQALRQLLVRQDQIRENERNHLARELHDELGQLLTGMRFMVSALQLTSNVTTSQANQIALELEGYLDETQAVLRRITRDLHPTQLEHGLLPALEVLATEFYGRSGVASRLTLIGPDPVFNLSDATSIFRIVQESLTNVARHAHAKSVSVHIESTAGYLNLKITDDGQGFDMALPSSNGQSFGLVGIQERAALLGATLKIISSPGQGAVIAVEIPINRKPIS